jgi:alkylation response protein AidB-like acyl-CoA dehydrogenase
LDVAKEISATKTPRIRSELLRDKSVVQAALRRAEAQLRVARAFLPEACDGAWSAVSRGTLVTLGQRVAVRLALAQVGEVAKAVVQAVYEIGRGTSIYDHCPLPRCFRDVHKASRHA